MPNNSDIEKFDELYLLDPENNLIKMDENEHHLEYLMGEFPEEDDYNEEFWDVVFEGGWIRVFLKKNSRNGYDITVNGESLRRMKTLIKDHFLQRLNHGENKVHIEERNPPYNKTHIFYLPQQRVDFLDFILENYKKRLVAESINEVQYFNREGGPLEKMGVGHQAQLDQIDRREDWGFTISPAFNPRTVAIEEYNGVLIKISSVHGFDGKVSYMPLDNSGEPYSDTPPLFDTLEQALEYQKKCMDLGETLPT
jgi:hypothetical protein